MKLTRRSIVLTIFQHKATSANSNKQVTKSDSDVFQHSSALVLGRIEFEKERSAMCELSNTKYNLVETEQRGRTRLQCMWSLLQTASGENEMFVSVIDASRCCT
jgi:2-C-methyl-D-erythritol 4-phosphate cytidylyltransferase